MAVGSSSSETGRQTGEEKFQFVQPAQRRAADGLTTMCQICQGVSGAVLGKQKWGLVLADAVWGCRRSC